MYKNKKSNSSISLWEQFKYYNLSKYKKSNSSISLWEQLRYYNSLGNYKCSIKLCEQSKYYNYLGNIIVSILLFGQINIRILLKLLFVFFIITSSNKL